MKETIIQLIQLDIQHTQFIENLNALGLTADKYYLNLSTVIFELLQFDRSTPQKADALQDQYFQLVLKAIDGWHGDRQKLQQEAERILDVLETSI
jgi:hypothetical protein